VKHATALIVMKTLHAFTQFSMILFFITRTYNAFCQLIIAALPWQHFYQSSPISRGPSKKQW